MRAQALDLEAIYELIQHYNTIRQCVSKLESKKLSKQTELTALENGKSNLKHMFTSGSKKTELIQTLKFQL